MIGISKVRPGQETTAAIEVGAAEFLAE